MSTYSFGQPPVDALKLQNLQAILNLLPDNSQKLISPKDVRDSIFTTWENIVFKTTNVSSSNVEYIGIDQASLKSKIYFGKKTVGGKEIMDDTLLNATEYDHFFYGTRPEPTPEHNTRIGFLAGTGSGFYRSNVLTIPYIEAKEVLYTNLEKYIEFDIRNKSYVLDGTSQVGGDINIVSDWGNVQLNGIVFPKNLQNKSSDNNDKYLKFVWDQARNVGIATWSSIGSVNSESLVSSATLSISGNPILMNGLAFNFSDPNPVPIGVGGIPEGTTFDNVPVTTVLRQLLYPYILPSIKTSFQYTFIESGDSDTMKNQILNWEITWTTEQLYQGYQSPPNLLRSSPPFPDVRLLPQGSSNGYVIPVMPTTVSPNQGFTTFTITTTIEDAPQRGNRIPATSTFYVVLPWFYGTSTNITIDTRDLTFINDTLTDLNQILRLGPTTNESVQVSLDTSLFPNKLGCVYFAYPSSYGDLTNILDQNGYPVFADYRKYTIRGLQSPKGYWGGSENRIYKIYVYAPGGTPALTIIPPLSKYTFVF